jgi:MFS family permease
VPSSSPKIWNRDFTLLFLSSFLTWGGFHFLLPTLPLYISDYLGGSPAQVGSISSLLALSTVLARPLAGYALDRWGRRPVYLLSMVLFCLVAFGYTLATSLALLAVIRVLQAVPFAGSTTGSNTIASDLVPPERRGEGLGLFGISGTLSMAIGPAAALAVLGDGQFSRMFLVQGLVAVAALLVSLPVRYPNVRNAGVSFTLSNLLERRVGWLSVATAFTYLAFGGIVTFITLYAEQYQIGGVGWFFAIYAAGLLVSRAISGRWFDRSGPRLPLYAGLALECAGLLALGLWRSEVGLAVAALLVGLGLGAMSAPIFAMAINLVPDERRGAANATVFTAIDLGIGVGSNVLGAVAQAASSYALMYVAAGAVLVVPMAIYVAKVVPQYAHVLGRSWP